MRNPSITFLLLLTTFSCFSQITINLPLSRSVFQRDNKNTSSIYVSGNYNETLLGGTPQKIEARLVPVKQGEGVTTDWIVITDKPENGTFLGNITGTGGWYQLQVRIWRNNAVVSQTTVDKLGIGEVFLIAGQSNAEGKRGFGEKSATDDRVNCFDYEKTDFLDEIPPFKSFSHLETNSSIAPRGEGGSWCWGELGDFLVKRLNVPVMFFNVAYGGTSIENWYSSSIGVTTIHPFYKYTFPRETPYSYMRITLQYYLSQLGMRAVLWCQGEAELDLKTTEDFYAVALKKVIDKSRFDSGKKISWVVSRTSLTDVNQTSPSIIKAQNRVINPTDYIFEGPYTDSIQVPRFEGVHFQNSGISDLAKAWDKKLSATFFSQSVPFLPAPVLTLKAACATLDKVTLSLPTNYSIQKWSNNTSSATITATSGSYSGIARDQTGNYYFTTNVDVRNVFPTKIPFAFAKKSVFFCEGTSTDLLTDSPDYPSFLWNTGETQKQISARTTGVYSVRGISAIGCASPESNTIFAQSLTLPGKPVIYQSDVAVCEGNSITLASTGIRENLWSTNENSPVISLNKVGDYSITVKSRDENGCISLSSDPAIFSIKPRPEVPEIAQIGAFTLQAKQKTELLNLNYEWRKGGSITPNKTAFIKAAKASFYTVSSLQNYTIANNKTITCRSNLSGAFSFIPDETIENVIIYPNPTPDGLITLEAQEDLADFSLIVYSLRGQFIYSTPIPALTERRLVDLSFLGEGKYIVKLVNSTFQETKNIWIEKK
jgi:Carbohydrate esterase, sialic acid-specific acetylesterase